MNTKRAATDLNRAGNLFMPLPSAAKLFLTESELKQLQALSRHRNTPHGTVLRVKIVLGAAQGIANRALARSLSTSVPTVLLWRKRYEKEGLSGILEDRRRSGRPKQITEEQESALVVEEIDNLNGCASELYLALENAGIRK